jgi:16S rRNA (cytosine967-C5)-methyltransferase
MSSKPSRSSEKPGTSSGMTYPRQHAIRVLTRVLSDHEALDDALNQAALQAGLSPAARAWLHEVCAGTLRWKGRLDLAIDSVALRKKPTGWLRKALMVAAYQLVAQDRAQPGAVVSETVSEVKRKEGEAPAKFANACLRKLSEHGQAFRSLAYNSEASASDAARWASMPEWLWSRLLKERGLAWASAYAQASLDRPVLWIRCQEGDAPVPQGAESGPFPGSFRLGAASGAIPGMTGFQEGRFFVQDISSQALVDGISKEVRTRLGSGSLRALDLCAAPGGKSAGLSWNGFQVTSTDRPGDGASRFALLQQTLSRVAPGARIVPRADVTSSFEKQDLVWVDAPCTGSGILRRHPDVRWLRQEKEVEILAGVQRELLREAWDLVRPGGFLAYSVCSVLRSEGFDRIEEWLKASSGKLVREWFFLPQEEPFGDGFWGALIQKS